MIGKLDIINTNASFFDTIELMKKTAFEGAAHPFFKHFIVKHRLNRNNLSKLYFCLYNYLGFEADDPELQIVKFPHKVLKDKKGNCVDFAVLVSAFLLNMDIPHSIRMTAFENQGEFNHVYIILQDKTPFDLWLGKEVKELPAQYGAEVQYKDKFDLKMI